jgi:hypothetical protein
MKYANCVGKAPNKREDPDALDPWFPDRGQSSNPGKVQCYTCPVRVECKIYQIKTHSLEGMWGGDIIPRKERKNA